MIDLFQASGPGVGQADAEVVEQLPDLLVREPVDGSALTGKRAVEPVFQVGQTGFVLQCSCQPALSVKAHALHFQPSQALEAAELDIRSPFQAGGSEFALQAGVQRPQHGHIAGRVGALGFGQLGLCPVAGADRFGQVCGRVGGLPRLPDYARCAVRLSATGWPAWCRTRAAARGVRRRPGT